MNFNSSSIGRSSDLRKTDSLKFDLKTRRGSSFEIKVPLLDLGLVQIGQSAPKKEHFAPVFNPSDEDANSLEENSRFEGVLEKSIRKIVINHLDQNAGILLRSQA